MKILDKYVAKNFLTGYAIAFGVLLGLRMVIDLFVNLDEFTESAGQGVISIIANIINYYGVQSTLYFRDFAGMIIVVAAAFSLGKMVRNNELTAIMASGVSLKRVIAPIIVLSIALTGLLVIDQELLIPSISHKLIRGQGPATEIQTFDVWFISDANGSLICSRKFDAKNSTLYEPVILLRRQIPGSLVWSSTGWIEAKSATYDPKSECWRFDRGVYTPIQNADSADKQAADIKRVPIAFYKTDLSADDIPIRRRAEYKALLSSGQLTQLAAEGTKLKDLAMLYSQKHFRITDPLMNIVMLLVCLPVLVCRDPKSMKSAITVSFVITSASLVICFICKLFATEEFFGRIAPELWAWLPIFIFAPIAFIELDSLKT
jgi:lipopolysaccharide export LptBFGC system permease protein LptF